jgi:ribosomal protein S18 acetylase RimI-like enzyme
MLGEPTRDGHGDHGLTGMLAIHPLGSENAAELSAMLTSQPRGYLRYFTPFAFDEATLARLLKAKVRDVYLGLYWDGELAAFCMLRGWDEGYEVPTYGVVVAERFQGKGLGSLTIELAKVISRLRGSPGLMLKVHPENTVAKALYDRAGFRQTALDSRTGQMVMHHDVLTAELPLDRS